MKPDTDQPESIDMLGDPTAARVLPRGMLDAMGLQNTLRCWAQCAQGTLSEKARAWMHWRAEAEGLSAQEVDEAIRHVLAGRTQNSRQERFRTSVLTRL
jgi:hypothetical protein